MAALGSFIARRGVELRQAARVTFGGIAAFIAYKLLGLEQGYWAVFTVIIVLQGSIGGTLGAALDRMAGTVAGAVLGAIALILFPHTPLGIGAALAVVMAITAFAASIRPQLRVAPVTAAILLLGQRGSMTTEQFVIDRVIEIALGGFIGVMTSMLVFPARSRGILVKRTGEVLAACAALLREEADALEHGAVATPGSHPALRKALAGVETAMVDAERERNARLADHGIPLALPRTLWRIRNDVAHVTRGMETALPPAMVPAIALPLGLQLRSSADFCDACALALVVSSTVERGDFDATIGGLGEAVAALRRAGLTHDLDFTALSRLFSLIFAMEQLHRNLTDLANRIDEAVAAPARRSLFGLSI